MLYEYRAPGQTQPDPPWSEFDKMSPGADNLGKRYYPTATALGDGSIIVVAGGVPCPFPWPPSPNDCGLEAADTPTVFTPFWPSGTQYEALTNLTRLINWYPFNFLLSDGTVLSVGGHYFGAVAADNSPDPPVESEPVPTLRLHPVKQQWTTVTTCPIKGGSAVMFRPDTIMKAGGGLALSGTCTTDNDSTTARAFVLDAGTTNPEWVEIAAMNEPRMHHILLTLPTGEVMAIGGTSATDGELGCHEAVLTPEVIDPDAQDPMWRVMAEADPDGPRFYHSVALLLPDGRVLSAGGEDSGDGFNIPYLNAQLFSPPYLFDSNGDPADRPTIVSVTGFGTDAMLYGGQAAVQTASTAEAASIEKVSFLRLGAVTHSFDHDARFMWLTFTVDLENDDALLVDAPPDGNHAPPGHYMLFILNGDGVPSEARIVRIGADCNGNDVFDFDDLMTGTMTDCNRNRYPDQCESLAVAPEVVHQAPKNRYLSINPSIHCDDEMAIQVTLSSMLRCSENAAISCVDNNDCPSGAGDCEEHAQVGQVVRWVGEPFDASCEDDDHDPLPNYPSCAATDFVAPWQS